MPLFSQSEHLLESIQKSSILLDLLNLLFLSGFGYFHLAIDEILNSLTNVWNNIVRVHFQAEIPNQGIQLFKFLFVIL